MNKKFFHFLAIALLGTGFAFTFIYGDPKDPSPQEKAAFSILFKKVKSNFALHPHALSEILQSFDDKWNYKVACPAGSMVDQVLFNITTKQIHWDRNLTIRSKPSGVGPNDIGWYQWTYESTIDQKIKTVSATNFIMLDPAVILANETNSPFDNIGDEALLYHELLHGQLVIDSIMHGSLFQKKVCNCNFDLSAGDFEHKYIPSFEIDYLSSILSKRGKEEPSAYVLKPVASPIESNSNFKLSVAEASILEGVENVRINWYLPRGNNVQENQVNVLVEDGKIWVVGTLRDKTKSGLLVIIIDVTN